MLENKFTSLSSMENSLKSKMIFTLLMLFSDLR